MSYLSRLSKTQRLRLVGTLVVAAAIVMLGWSPEPKGDNGAIAQFDTTMSIRDIAPKLGSTGKSLARDLGLPLDVPKKKPLAKLGIKQKKLDRVVGHVRGHKETQLKYYVFAALVLFGLVFLVRLGRPDGAPIADRKLWYPRAVYIAALVVAVVVCGFMLGKSPNPMEGTVKTFKAMVGLYPSVWGKVVPFLFFLVLAIVGNKLVCGWACPFGALQELLYSLPSLDGIRRRKVPFWLSNTIRGGLVVLTLLFLFGVLGGKKGFVIYHYINPFNLFNLDFDHLSILVAVVVSLVLALAIYRPFCQFICPFGFISWIAERFSITRVRVDRQLCNKCGACDRVCPSGAAGDIVEGKLFAADCYSCARCLNVCPHDAIDYGFALGKPFPKAAD